MAALVCIAYSIGVHFYRASRVFCETGGSFHGAINYLIDVRNETLDNLYLQRLDEIYGQPKSRGELYQNKRKNYLLENKPTMDADEQSCNDFIAIETAIEATENELRGVSENIIVIQQLFRIFFYVYHDRMKVHGEDIV